MSRAVHLLFGTAASCLAVAAVHLAQSSSFGAGGGNKSKNAPIRLADRPRPSAFEAITFEGLPRGTVLHTIFGDQGTGPFSVSGTNPFFPAGTNAAVVFDSSNPTGGDIDLGTPNVNFGGPGVGAGGASGPFVNDQAHGKILIVAEDLNDGNGDGLVDDPDDVNAASTSGAKLDFNFSAVGSITLYGMTFIDLEPPEQPTTISFFGTGGQLLSTMDVPVTGNNGVAHLDFAGIPGVASLRVHMRGSGAIDDLLFRKDCFGSIGDFVWNDLDRDGIQDAGEPGIMGVMLRLTDLQGTTLALTTTGSNGGYEFPGLCADTYVVTVLGATLPPGLVASPCDAGANDALDSDCSPVTVVLTDDVTENPTIDFGYNSPCAGTIGDFVWNDLDRDGIQDPGEPGIQGVLLRLRDAGNAVIATTSTGPNGGYSFVGLCAGTYTVEVEETTLPPDFVPSPCNVGSNDAIDNDCSPVTVVLPSDFGSNPTLDFGYNSPCTGTIGDFVWLDIDRDGIQDPSEPGIESVGVALKDSDGATIATTTTGRKGHYLFAGLCAGDYEVVVDEGSLPPGYVASPCNVGLDDDVDNDCSPVAVTLPLDDTEDLSIDFGYNVECTGLIGDYVWNDLDRDGIQDVGEPGIEDVTVILKNDVGVVLETVTTGPFGFYSFMGLCAGTYLVEVDPSSLPPGLVPSPCDAGGDDALDNDCSPVTVVLPADDTEDVTIDFGYNAPCSGIIGDFVWDDSDCNGLQDPDELGIEDVLVVLRDEQGVIVQSASTDVDGRYQFTDLCAGTYTVEIDPTTVPCDYAPTLCDVGSDDEVDSECSPVTVILVDDFVVDLSIDFGFCLTPSGGGEGCTPGYWKQSHHFDSWPAPYTPSTLFSDVFEDAFPGMDLHDVLSQGGGGLNALGRHTVAALLNAASPDVSYDLTPGEVISLFDDLYPATTAEYNALKDYFEDFNQQGCPLN